MRTIPEIIARIHEKKGAFLDFTADVLIGYLPYDDAKPFLRDGTTETEWNALVDPLTRETVVGIMRNYMAGYGWDKALNHRGISAGRTVNKLATWCWLVGEDTLVDLCDDAEKYPQYGVPILMAICAHFGFPIPDDERVKRMAVGLPCVPDCVEGCGI